MSDKNYTPVLATLIKRQLHDHILDFRFLTVLVLAIVLFGLGAFVGASRRRAQAAEYAKHIDAQRQTIRRAASRLANFATLRLTFHRLPSQFSFICEGGEKYLPDAFPFTISSFGQPERSGRMNPLLPFYYEIDWAK